MTVNIFNIQHFSTHDGPGIRTTVFFKGCPLDCIWCHNPEGKSPKPQLSLIDKLCIGCGACKAVCPRGAHRINNGHTIDREICTVCGRCAEVCSSGALELIGREWSIDEVVDNIRQDAFFFGRDGGVTLSGGEPFAQPDALLALLTRFKAEGWHTCVETSGYTDGIPIRAATAYTDLFLYDCKETDDERHRKYTGVGRKRILDNLRILDEADARVILRCPMVGGINDRNEHFEAVIRLADAYHCIEAVELEPYHPLGIAKGRQIGHPCVYGEEKFFDKSKLNGIISAMQRLTDKPVRLS